MTTTASNTAHLGSRTQKLVLLFVVFLIAACGLVYELALISLGSFLIGSSIQQTSIVLAVLVFAMGIGSLLAKPLLTRPVTSFAFIEAAIGLVGGLSVFALYGAFAWLKLYSPALIFISLLLGLLIGCELPLMMVLLQQIRSQKAGDASSELLAADYVGALIGGLAFPFLLLPTFGQLQGALLVGALNVVAAAACIGSIFRHQLRKKTKTIIFLMFAAVLAILGFVAITSASFEVQARQKLFRDPIIHESQTQYQQIVMTESFRFGKRQDVRLYLNGDLQFSSFDEYRYHEALVHPALAKSRSNVLILGGGDGLAAREVLKYDDVDQVTLVELDPAITDLARTDTRLSTFNNKAFEDNRMKVINTDAFLWLRENTTKYDAIIIDMPDADDIETAKLYSVEFYTLVRNSLVDEGLITVQSGSPFFAPEAFWSIDAGITEAGFTTLPYHVNVPSFGDWGFVLATVGSNPEPAIQTKNVPTSFFTQEVFDSATVFSPDLTSHEVRPSTMLDPVIIQYTSRGWQGE